MRQLSRPNSCPSQSLPPAAIPLAAFTPRRSEFAQSRRDRKLCGSQAWKKSADEAKYERVDQCLYQQVRRDCEGKRDLTERREIHRGGLHAVEGEIRNSHADQTADETDDQRLDEH